MLERAGRYPGPGYRYDPFETLPRGPSLGDLYATVYDRESDEDKPGLFSALQRMLQGDGDDTFAKMRARERTAMSPAERIAEDYGTAGPGEAAARAGLAGSRSPLGHLFASAAVQRPIGGAATLVESFGPESMREGARDVRMRTEAFTQAAAEETADYPWLVRTGVQAAGSSMLPIITGGLTAAGGTALKLGRGALRAVTTAGAATGALPASVAEMHSELETAGVEGDSLRYGTLVGGSMIAALEGLVPGRLIAKVMPGLNRMVTTSLIRATAKGAVQAGGQEAITEAIQQQIPALANAILTEDHPYFTKEQLVETLQAAAAGGVGGFLLGAGFSAYASGAGAEGAPAPRDDGTTPLEPTELARLETAAQLVPVGEGRQDVVSPEELEGMQPAETITAAALRIRDTGETFTASTHGEAQANLIDTLRKRDTPEAEINRIVGGRLDVGFRTSDRAFIDNIEAEGITDARESLVSPEEGVVPPETPTPPPTLEVEPAGPAETEITPPDQVPVTPVPVEPTEAPAADEFWKGDERAIISRNTRAGQPIEGTDRVEGPWRVTFMRRDPAGGFTGIVHQDTQTPEEARQAALDAGFQVRGPEPVAAAPAIEQRTEISVPSTGQATKIVTADDVEYAASYAIIANEEAPSSHDPFGFDPTPGYPEGLQERRYHADRSAQEEVAKRAAALNPDRLLDPTFSPTEGPPIVTSTGLRLSGSGRGMILVRARELHSDLFDEYVDQIVERAESFGIARAEAESTVESLLRQGKTPELVRVMPDVDEATARELVSKFNDVGTKARDILGDAATRARRLQETGALDRLAESLRETETVRAYLEEGRSRPFVQSLVSSGVITSQESGRFIDQETSLLNPEGKQLVERMLTSLAIGDPETIARAPKSMLQRIEKAVPAIIKARSVKGWDVGPILASAMNVAAKARADNLTLEQLGSQMDLLGGEVDPVGLQVAQFIQNNGANQVATAIRAIAQDATATSNEDLFGGRAMTLKESIAAHLTPEGRKEADSRRATIEVVNREDPLDPANTELFSPAPPLTPPKKPRLPALPAPGKPVSAPEVIEQLAGVVRAAGGATPIRTGRMGGKARSALGVFKVKPEVIRLLQSNDIPTAAHEVAHALEKHVFGWPKGGPWTKPRVSKLMQDELVKLGRDLYGDTKPAAGYKREGFAEYISFFVTDPASAKRKAPVFTEFFDGEFARQFPGVRKALEQAQELAIRYQEQGSVARGIAGIARPPSVAKRVRQSLASAPARLYESFGESAQPLYELAREAERSLGRKLGTLEDPYEMSIALRLTHSARVKYMIEKGMIGLNGMPTGGPALNDIRSLIVNTNVPIAYASQMSRGEMFVIYLWARRSRALLEDVRGPRDPGLTLEDAKQIIEELGNKSFAMAADLVYQWNAGVLNYAAEASPTFARVAEQVVERDPGDYVPLHREFEELDSRWRSSKGATTTTSPVKRLVGSGRRVKDPLASMISQAEQTIRAAHQRVVLDRILRLSKVEGLGHLIEEVPRDRAPVLAKTIEQLLEEVSTRAAQMGDVDATQAIADVAETMDEDLLGEMVTFFAPKWRPTNAKPDELIVPIWDGEAGRVRWYQVSQGLYQSLAGMDIARLPRLIDLVAGLPARLSRAGYTSMRASFGLVWNPANDAQTFAVNTRASSMNLPRLLGESLAGMADAMTEKVTGGRYGSEFIDVFMRLGGPMAQRLGEDIPQTRRATKRLTSTRREMVLDPRNWWDAYREFIQTPEAGPRVAELRQVAKEVGWEPGDFMSLEQSIQMLIGAKQVTTDFTAAGPWARMWNQVTPFFNASIQGPRATFRAARRNPQAVAARMLQLSLLSIALWWKFRDDEWYEEKSYKERYRFWYFPVKVGEFETLMRLPRGHDIGAATSVVQAIAEAAYDDDPEAFTKWWENLWDVVSPGLLPVIPDIAAEQLANREFFFDRPIVPMGESRRPVEEQFNEYTDRVSIKLGEIFHLSPRRIQHVRKGILGSFSSDVLQGLGLRGPKPRGPGEAEPADWPVIGRMFQRGGRVNPGSKSIDALYEALELAQRHQASTRTTETPLERQLRLQLNDAARAVSAISFIRQQTPDAVKRSQLNLYRSRLARQAMDDYEAQRVNRGKFSALRRGTAAEKEAISRQVRLQESGQ